MYGGGAETPKFQSTHPVRGATPDCNRVVQDALFQSTHPVRGATYTERGIELTLTKFQSTHPVRGATLLPIDVEALDVISIHAPREGCVDCRFRR